MVVVRAKKNLGQHFLTDKSIALKIVESLVSDVSNVLEIGPGMGVLTEYLFQSDRYKTIALDIDRESVEYLKQRFPSFAEQILYGDFLRSDLNSIFGGERVAIIGNFPYNISTQILFRVLDFKDIVPEVVGMFQKEVAQRIAAPPGSKVYGITSVLLQAYYSIDYLFTVDEHVFSPPPKVKSAVIRLTRNNVQKLDCDEKLFARVVKAGFNQRRKMLRNSLKSLIQCDGFLHPFLEKRPEQLSLAEFVELTQSISSFLTSKNNAI
ncbi:MAG: 16S rRNA (adenine(1518)-N(6)/adenine(1519)-N(6))-dimethyltransferase RsmA [Bacteroidales bacterium]|nr:16S rRNA (adenine(1518)-N(6)/adenine(1519)-N(6))-dimethyltransferase RsmA [Bacteroidales bacterium]